MRNYIQKADTITITAPAVPGCKSGDVVTVGNIVGIAVGDALPGAEVELALTGAYRLAKNPGALHVGDVVTWATNAVEAAGDLCLGVVIAEAAADATEAVVRLGGVVGTVDAGLATRMDAAETAITDLDGRVEALEGA